MRIYIKCLFLVLAILLNPLIIRGNRVYNAGTVTIRDGLPSNQVYYIRQDNPGFIWIGTNEGLVRYDGVRLTPCRNGEQGQNLNLSKVIRTIYADRAGAIWVGTDNSGLFRVDNVSLLLIPFRPVGINGVKFMGESISAITEDRSGRIWIGTNKHGVYRYNPDSKELHNYIRTEGSEKSLSHYSVSDIMEDRSGTIWITTYGGGLNQYNPGSDDFTHYKDIASGSGIITNNFTSIIEDHRGRKWIGTLTDGLIRFDPQRGIIKVYPISWGKGSVSGNYVTAVFEDSSNILWAGMGNGLNRYSEDRDSFEEISDFGIGPGGTGSEIINSITEDRSGILWVGTPNGVLMLNRFDPSISLYRNKLGNSSSLNNDLVRAMDEDPEGNIWVGTENGLNRFIPASGTFRRYSSERIKKNKIISMRADHRGVIWIGSHNGYMYKFDLSSETFKPTFLSGDTGSYGSFSIIWIFEDSDHNLWVSGYGNGLFLLNEERKFVKRYLHEPGNPHSLINNTILSISEGPPGTLWMSSNYGLARFDRAKESFTAYTKGANIGDSLNTNNISLTLKVNHDLWIGTKGNGLNRLDLNTGEFSYFLTSDGLPSNFIYGILADTKNRVWISTGKGLSRLDPKTGEILNLDLHEGLQGYEYFPGSCLRSANGELYFGGIHGFNILRPDIILPGKYKPPVFITSIGKIDRAGIRHTRNYSGGPVDFNPGDHRITFNFAALDYSNPEKIKYAYKLEGMEDRWIRTDGKQPFAVYSTIAAGEYTFKLKATNSDGIWNPEILSVQIRMHPPFWGTLWFKLLILIVFSCSLFQLYRVRLNRAIRKMEYRNRVEHFCRKNGLSDRECEVLGLLLQGKSNKEIEDVLFISQNTVRNHVYNIYQKLKVSSRVQLLKLFENAR